MTPERATEIAKDLVGELTMDMFYRLGEHIISWTEAEKHGKRIADAIHAAVLAEREACSEIAENPYGEEVQAFVGLEPKAVGYLISHAIRARTAQDEGE